MDGTNIARWYTDASFAVHPDMKSHTGYIMTLGKGAVIASSTKQKINTKSSTESELVVAGNATTPLLWSKWFMEEQGYNIKPIMYQDNQSSMKLEQNGKESSSKRTRHINIRYFFITDCIARKELKVGYCPTDDMIADYLTKPLQGRKYIRFRKESLNIHPDINVEQIADKNEDLIPDDINKTNKDSNNERAIKNEEKKVQKGILKSGKYTQKKTKNQQCTDRDQIEVGSGSRKKNSKVEYLDNMSINKNEAHANRKLARVVHIDKLAIRQDEARRTNQNKLRVLKPSKRTVYDLSMLKMRSPAYSMPRHTRTGEYCAANQNFLLQLRSENFSQIQH